MSNFHLKLNATYPFAYYMIDDSNVLAIDELVTLNHDHGYRPVKEEKHDDIIWKTMNLFLQR